MHNPAETPSSVSYPTQYGAPAPLNGNVAETPMSLHAYRDGLFNQGIPSHMPGPLTAYRGGLFSSPLGQVAGGLDFTDPAVVLEWTTMMEWTWETDPPAVPTSTWNQAISDLVLAAAQALLSQPDLSNLPIDGLVHLASDGFYYPRTMMVMMGFGPAYNQQCWPSSENCPFPKLRDYYDSCVPVLSGMNESDASLAVAAANAGCPILYPAAAPGTRAQTPTTEPTATASMAGSNRALTIGGVVALALLLGGAAFWARSRR